MIHFLYNYNLTKEQSTKSTRWLHWQLFKYLQVKMIAYYKTISTDELGVDVHSDIVVSLTSFPARINVVYLAIRSLLNQTQKPKKIVLWLGEEFFPFGEDTLPNSLLELKPLGLEIEFCKDLKAHTKYYYAFQEYPNNLIVTVDDDIIYPNNILKILLETHQRYPNCVVANRVRYMEMEKNSFKPYRKWKVNRLPNNKPSKRIFATGVSGVLYQPHLFLNSIFDVDGIRQTNCIGDDIWLKAAQVENNVSVVSTNSYLRKFIEIPESQKVSLFRKNVLESDNDRQINEVFDYFGIKEASFDDFIE